MAQDKGNKTDNDFFEKVIKIRRINKVVKGGKRLAFRSFVIVGDEKGSAALGLGKSKEVPSSIKKAIDRAKKSMNKMIIVNGTLPHEVHGKFGSSRVIIRPAKPGTGVIAGGAVAILLHALGIKDAVAKTMGSRNPINAARAAYEALQSLRSLKQEEQDRGIKLPVYTAEQK